MPCRAGRSAACRHCSEKVRTAMKRPLPCHRLARTCRPLLWVLPLLWWVGAVPGAPDGMGDGSSWAQAAPLQGALADAACSEIWVKQATDQPTAGTDRSVGFAINRPLKLYGGFAGTEAALAPRSSAAVGAARGQCGAGARTGCELVAGRRWVVVPEAGQPGAGRARGALKGQGPAPPWGASRAQPGAPERFPAHAGGLSLSQVLGTYRTAGDR